MVTNFQICWMSKDHSHKIKEHCENTLPYKIHFIEKDVTNQLKKIGMKLEDLICLTKQDHLNLQHTLINNFTTSLIAKAKEVDLQGLVVPILTGISYLEYKAYTHLVNNRPNENLEQLLRSVNLYYTSLRFDHAIKAVLIVDPKKTVETEQDQVIDFLVENLDKKIAPVYRVREPDEVTNLMNKYCLL
jgi:hypothetical protein